MDCNISKTKCSSMKRANINQLATNCGVDSSLFTNKVKLCEAIVDKNKQIPALQTVCDPCPPCVMRAVSRSDDDIPSRASLEKLTLAKLKQFAKERKLVGFSSAKNKPDLITFILNKLSQPQVAVAQPPVVAVQPQVADNLESMTIAQLKQFAKDNKLVGFSKAKSKPALIAFIREKLRPISRPTTPIARPVSPLATSIPNLEKLTIAQLKQFAKERNITGFSYAKTKAALIAFIKRKLEPIVRPVSPIVRPVSPMLDDYNKVKNIILNLIRQGVNKDEITLRMIKNVIREQGLEVDNLKQLAKDVITTLEEDIPIIQIQREPTPIVSPVPILSPRLADLPIEDVLTLIKEPSVDDMPELEPITPDTVSPVSTSPVKSLYSEQLKLKHLYEDLYNDIKKYTEEELLDEVRRKLIENENKSIIDEEIAIKWAEHIDRLRKYSRDLQELENKYPSITDEFEAKLIDLYGLIQNEIANYERPIYLPESPTYIPLSPSIPSPKAQSPTYIPVTPPISPPSDKGTELDLKVFKAITGIEIDDKTEAYYKVKNYMEELTELFTNFYREIDVLKSREQILSIVSKRYSEDLSSLLQVLNKTYKNKDKEVKQLIADIKRLRENMVTQYPVQQYTEEEPIVRRPVVQFIEEPTIIPDIIPEEEPLLTTTSRDLSMVNTAILKCLGLLS